MDQDSASRLLYLLKSRGPSPSAALARALGITLPGIRQHLARFAAEGLVEHAEEAGFEPSRWREAADVLDDLVGWIEMHIEQARVLQDTAGVLGRDERSGPGSRGAAAGTRVHGTGGRRQSSERRRDRRLSR